MSTSKGRTASRHYLASAGVAAVALIVSLAIFLVLAILGRERQQLDWYVNSLTLGTAFVVAVSAALVSIASVVSLLPALLRLIEAKTEELEARTAESTSRVKN